MAWNMVRHAFVMVFGNLPQALKASILPFVIGIALSIAIFTVFGLGVDGMMGMGGGFNNGAGMGQMMAAGGNRGPFLLGMLLTVIVYLLVLSWVAVTWHRFILLEEYPGILPKFDSGRILSYTGTVILIALILLIIAIPLSIVIGLVLSPIAMTGNMSATFVIGLIAGFVVGTLMAWFWYRFAVCLPGIAVGKPMGISEAWGVTKPASADIFQMALILVGLNIAATVVLMPIAMGMPLVGQLISLIINWITLMVGASILTTLYGHLVEGRSLVD